MNAIDDQTAIHMLKTIAHNQPRSRANERTSDASLGSAPKETFGDIPQTVPAEGGLAQAALALLSEDARCAEPIRVMILHAVPQRYIEPTTIALPSRPARFANPNQIQGGSIRKTVR